MNISKPNNEYDAVIIGAGPAGLNCAKFLGNLNILILEKNSEIGPKVCAGGLTQKSLDYLKLPDKLIEKKFNKIKIHVNEKSSNIKDKDNFVYTIDRKKLGQWQLNKLKKFKNITIKTNSYVNNIEKKYITVNNEKIKYKFLIGADGSNSLVKKYLNIKTKKIGLAIQYIIPRINKTNSELDTLIDKNKFEDFEIFFEPKLFSAWYAWIFPHEKYVSVGCGCDPSLLSSSKLMNNFKIWLKKNNINTRLAKLEAFAIDCDYQGYEFNNVFLIGDAGGFASSLTGEGIYQALITGEEIAKKIVDKNYKPRINKLLKTKKTHDKIIKIIMNSRFKTLLFNMVRHQFKIKFFRKKILELT